MMRRKTIGCRLWALVLLAAIGCCTAARAHEDQIALLVSPFAAEGAETAALGRTLALALRLPIRGTLRASMRSEDDAVGPFGGGSAFPLGGETPIRSHAEAERVTRLSGAQLALWGDVLRVGELAFVQPYLTIPTRYADFRRTHHEQWSLVLEDLHLSVELPRRRLDFAPIGFTREQGAQYDIDLTALPLCRRKGDGCDLGAVGDVSRLIQTEGAYWYVRAPVDRFGYIRMPPLLDERTEAVAFIAGMIMIFRGDWLGAADFMASVAKNPLTRPRLQSDAALLQGMALIRGDNEYGLNILRQQFERCIDCRTPGQYVVMAATSLALRTTGKTRRGHVAFARGFLAEASRAISDPAWVKDANQLLVAIPGQ
jgi:hypothetical protein